MSEYLTYEEYETLSNAVNIPTEEQFPKLLSKASDVVDSITRSFYQFQDLEEDHAFRKKQFKKAVACQIDYFADNGGTSSYMLNTPQSVSIGRTTVSMGSDNSNGNEETLNGLLNSEAYMYLRATGLLYRGVRRC